MSSEAPLGQAPRDSRTPPDGEPWFATFTLLDTSGAISSWQWQRFVAAVAQLWRRTVRRLV